MRATQTTSHEPRATSNRQQATGNRQQATGDRRQATTSIVRQPRARLHVRRSDSTRRVGAACLVVAKRTGATSPIPSPTRRRIARPSPRARRFRRRTRRRTGARASGAESLTDHRPPRRASVAASTASAHLRAGRASGAPGSRMDVPSPPRAPLAALVVGAPCGRAGRAAQRACLTTAPPLITTGMSSSRRTSCVGSPATATRSA